jgi:Superinfection immunity protein
MKQILGLVAFSLLTAAYFAPSIVAALRKHHQVGPVAVVNFFLGWTLVGWVVAMAMALSAARPRDFSFTYAPFTAADQATRIRADLGPVIPPTQSAWPPPAPHGEPPQERTA